MYLHIFNQSCQIQVNCPMINSPYPCCPDVSKPTRHIIFFTNDIILFLTYGISSRYNDFVSHFSDLGARNNDIVLYVQIMIYDDLIFRYYDILHRYYDI